MIQELRQTAHIQNTHVKALIEHGWPHLAAKQTTLKLTSVENIPSVGKRIIILLNKLTCKIRH